MLEEARILERVQRVVTEELGVDEKDIRPESKFTDDLLADSLDLVELIIAFENEFENEFKAAGVKDGISDEEAEKLVSVQDVVAYIVDKTNDD